MKNKKLFAILTLVCFMFTLMPVAAFAAGPAQADTSVFTIYDSKSDVTPGEKVKFLWQINGTDDKTANSALANVYIWAEDENGNRTSALELWDSADNGTTFTSTGVNMKADYTYGPYSISDASKTWVSFARDGVYKVYAGVYGSGQTIVDAVELKSGSEINVTSASTDPQEYYRASVVEVRDELTYTATAGKDLWTGATGVASDGETLGTISVKPNNIASKVIVKFTESSVKISDTIENKTPEANGVWNADKLKATVTASTDSANIQLDKETYTTDSLGEIAMELSASREGNYTIYLNVNGVDFQIAVACGNTAAAYIEAADIPTAPVALYENEVDVTFDITDINGNMVKDLAVGVTGKGADKLFDTADVKYLSFTEKPAASKLANKNLYLSSNNDGSYSLKLGGVLDAEGTYTVKAVLDNGAYATATWEVKKFGTPVMIYTTAATVVELGKTLYPEAKYVDANGVEKAAKDAKITATGYAVASLTDAGNGTAYIGVKTDEKYAGTTFDVTVVSERYDLVRTQTVKVVGDGVTVEFADENLEVNVNNKVDWYIADTEGNKVRLNDADHQSTRYVVLDKPEGAKVSVYDAATIKNGEGTMALTSNKVGNVTVQIIVQYKLNNTSYAGNNQLDNLGVQTKYYTATKIFAVGTEGVGDVVVMSVGSNEIVINDAKATIDAAPIVANNRTFVPFRALAEAFGAEVAYDEATQAVTAELNGVTVVMTIGSAEYTVNGEAKTADVAPFINGSRTMVPVRFAAEAFGIKVIPTYDENGATADILFNL